MKDIKVSIVVPVYNASKYLSFCIDSIINQTYKNLEIILVNDGSTDNSGSICDEYGKKDNRITVIHQENQGVSKTRNNGLKRATGEYLTFIDADDIISENYVELLLKDISENTLNICTLSLFDKEITKRDSEGDIIELSKDNFITICKYGLINTPCCKLFSIKILKEKNITFDTSLSLGEDLLFNLDYFNYIDKINIIDKDLYFYRRSETNTLSSSYEPNMKSIQLRLFDTFTNYFKDKISNKEQYKLYDSYRFGIVMLIVHNEFKNKKVSFTKRLSNTKKILKEKDLIERLNTIKYPPRKLDYTLISHRLILVYKVINKIRNI